MKKLIAMISFTLTVLFSTAYPHAARTEDAGCHYDHQTGIYRC